MKILTFAILLITCFELTCYSQEANITKFIPKNYSILNLTKGNLNLDNIDDLILVLSKNGEDSISTIQKPVKRNLLILIGKPDKSYKLIAQNENIVYFYNYDLNFKDAFVYVKIEKGSFSVGHYGGFAKRWGRDTVFKYYKPVNNWFLFEDEYSTMDARNSEEPNKILSEKKLTKKDFGKIPFDKFNIYKEWK